MQAHNEGSALTDPSEDDKNSEATPTKDVMQTLHSDFGEDTSSTSKGKKRKKLTTGGTSAKRSTIMKRKNLRRNYFELSKELHLASYQPPGFLLHQQVRLLQPHGKRSIHTDEMILCIEITILPTPATSNYLA